MAKITFDTIDGGGLAEQFRLALAQIGRNIIDPNMDPKEKRGLVVNLNFIPGETGREGRSVTAYGKWSCMKKVMRAFGHLNFVCVGIVSGRWSWAA